MTQDGSDYSDDYKRLLEDPELCWTEAQDRILYEWARACHGALWRKTVSAKEARSVYAAGRGYHNAVEVLLRFIGPNSYSDIDLASASMFRLLQYHFKGRRTIVETATEAFIEISTEATYGVESCYYQYRLSEEKDPAWKLRATVSQAVAMMGYMFTDSSYEYKDWIGHGFQDKFGLWFETKVFSDQSSYLIKAAMQTICMEIMDWAAYQLATEAE